MNEWHGQTEKVLDYLKNSVEAKNEAKLQELITYIEKHQEEIIDYDKRKKVGKKVGLKPSPVDETAEADKTDEVDEADVIQNQVSKAYHATKKAVGSGRVEKACDNVIGKRQKHFAKSWSRLGSRSLAILKVVELNNKWFEIWGPSMAANDSLRPANDPYCEPVRLSLVA